MNDYRTIGTFADFCMHCSYCFVDSLRIVAELADDYVLQSWTSIQFLDATQPYPWNKWPNPTNWKLK